MTFLRRFLRQPIALALAALVAFQLVPVSVHAATMSPIRLEPALDPGSSTDSVVKIYNDEKTTRTYYLSVVKFDTKDETGEPRFIYGDREGLPSWVSLPASVTVDPQQAKEVDFKINVPKDAEPGGYFAAVFASVRPPNPGDSQVAVGGDVGTLLLLRVNGQFEQGESILEFDTKSHGHWFNHLPVEFFFRFQNTGADRAQPLGDITIRNLFGRISKIVTANRGAGNVLPESTRRFDSAWVTSGGDIVERFNGQIEQPQFKSFFDAVKYQWQHFALGRYTANLQVTVNHDSSRTYPARVAFWVMPWQLILVILAILVVFIVPLAALVALIIWLIILRRRRKRQGN